MMVLVWVDLSYLFTVPSASFWKLGQAKPSEKFKFKEVSVYEAQEMRSEQTAICTQGSII